MRGFLRDQRGFSLIELLVVIIILGLIAGLVGPRLFGRVGQSKQAAARAQIELLGAGLDQYRLDIGAYPPSGAGFAGAGTKSQPGQLERTLPQEAGRPARPLGPSLPVQVLSRRSCRLRQLDARRHGAPRGEGKNADVASWEAK
jgi:general secretion pathway protein G